MYAWHRAIAWALLVSLSIVGCGTAEPTLPQVPSTATPMARIVANTPTLPTVTPPPPALKPTSLSPTATAILPTNTPPPTNTRAPPAATATPLPPPSASGGTDPEPTRRTSPPAGATIGDTWTRPTDGMVMVYVPGGTFQMGSSEAQIAEALDLCHPFVTSGECPKALFDDETPQHAVTLDGFWIDQTEVTNAQYRLCLEAGVCQDTDCLSNPDANAPQQPIGCVTWDDANSFCQWAGARLPTEAEWEYAARGPGARVFPWGDRFDPNRVNYCDLNCYSPWRDTDHDDRYNLAAPVGEFASGASWCGALNMAGNVLEWVADWYDAGYYHVSPVENPPGPSSGTEHVIRGGASNQIKAYQRTAWRSSLMLSGWYGLLGVRCAASPVSTLR